MQPAVELAFGHPSFDVAVFGKETTAAVLVAAEERNGDQRDSHHLSGR